MSAQPGHMLLLQWFNPYTSPPDGLARVQAQGFVLRGGDRCPAVDARFMELGGFGSGWSVYHRAVLPPARRHSAERKAATRRRSLERRVRAKVGPMFADEVIASQLEKKPAYYAGQAVDPDCAAYVAQCDADDARLWQAWLDWLGEQTEAAS